MDKKLKAFGVTSGILASLICFAAGCWILCRTGLTFNANGDDEFVWEAIGIYFIGKAFFVGPMLILNALKK